MKNLLVFGILFLSLGLMAQEGVNSFLRVGMTTPNTILQSELSVLSVDRDFSLEAGVNFKSWGFVGEYSQTAAHYAALDFSTINASNCVVSRKMIGISYLFNQAVKNRDFKGYKIYSLTGLGYGLGQKHDAAIGGFEGKMIWNYLHFSQDFSFYLDRTKRRTDEKAFSSISFKGSLGMPLSVSTEVISKKGIPGNVYNPTLPEYFGSASLTPKFKLFGAEKGVVNMLISASYYCRPYDFRPGANWYNIQLGISVDRKSSLSEIASVKLSVANGDMKNMSRVGGHMVEISLNLMGLFFNGDWQPKPNTPQAK